MLMTFQSNAYADITMFGEIGLEMVAMMGHRKTASGAIKAEGIPQALEHLTSALSLVKANTEQTQRYDEEDDDEQDELPISLANRAVPLIKMLNAAIKEECHVMWESK